MEETKVSQGEFQVGKLWKRFIAYALDMLLLIVVTTVALITYALITSGGLGLDARLAQFKQGKDMIIYILVVLLWMSYFIYFTGKTGQTVGKKLMGLKVVSLDGNIIGYRMASLRYLCFVPYWLKSVSLVTWLITLIMAITDKQRRALHDRIAKTIVVSTSAI